MAKSGGELQERMQDMERITSLYTKLADTKLVHYHCYYYYYYYYYYSYYY